MLSKFRFLILGAAAALLTTQCLLFAGITVPERPSGYVTDLAGLLAPSEKAQLEAELSSYEAKTTHQIVLLTLPSLEGEGLEDVAMRTAEKWKPGQAGRDNGVLILIAVQEHAIRIEVGYGLEPYLTDLTAGRIIRNIMVPHFKAQAPAAAIQTGVTAIMQAIAGADLPELAEDPMAEGDRLLLEGLRWILGIMGILFLLDLGRYGLFFTSHRSENKRYSFIEWFFIFSFLLAVISVLFKVLVQLALSSRGGYYGSGRGTGGHSGRGFSGGGGSFGGGGASGRW